MGFDCHRTPADVHAGWQSAGLGSGRRLVAAVELRPNLQPGLFARQSRQPGQVVFDCHWSPVDHYAGWQTVGLGSGRRLVAAVELRPNQFRRLPARPTRQPGPVGFDCHRAPTDTMQDGKLLDWVPADGSWRLWNYDPTYTLDCLPGNPTNQGQWPSMVTGHSLTPMQDGKLLDWVPGDGSWRLWNYDPTNSGECLPGKTEDITQRCWQFPPFKEINPTNVLLTLFENLQPGQPDHSINEWRDNPFMPHVVARNRPSAYMKYVVIKYIETLIAYGDYYFQQNTMETISLAIQCYVMAAHLYGPRGQKIPKQGKIEQETYMSLRDKWDAFGNALVQLELAFPFSNQTINPLGDINGDVVLPNIFGFGSMLYFGIPNNPQLSSLRDTIDDRLLKLRSCENIQGIFQQLPPFEPPIDPALLVQAAAQGLSLSSVLNDMESPMPNYRFYYLLQKALELCSELKAIGNAFLSIKEKGDAEALSNLRAVHETNIQNLVMEVKKKQLEEAQASLDGLVQSRSGPVSRMQYYLQLIGEDLSKTPDESTDFSDLPNVIEQPVSESGLKLISLEKEEMDKANSARDLQIAVGVVETLASILHIIPNLTLDAEPFGIGTDTWWGGANLGSAAEAIARGLQIGVTELNYQSSNSGRKGGFLRQLQDRVQQANNAGYEIKNIDKQILTQQIRIEIANQEINHQQQQIDNAQTVEDFLRNKYTNEELYSWMEGNISILYHQAYTLAYDLAKKAEKAFRFERGLTNSNFIQYGYWDAGWEGLLAGERLYLALKQLETAYQEQRGYDYEITKHVSLRQLDPLALIQLREKQKCGFTLPEVFFDMDHPGQYMRRIKSVALTIPCVAGPYTSVNCTLRLVEHTFRTSPVASSKDDYLQRTDGTEDRFSTVNVPISSIAVSSGQNDSGVFELNFHDERYIPFEGAGAISKWQIELPSDYFPFDYDTISDVILHVRYTAVEGGDNFKKAALGSIDTIIQTDGLFAFFDLKHDFPGEWDKANNPQATPADRGVMTLSNLTDHLPFFTKSRTAKKAPTTSAVYIFSSATPDVTYDQFSVNGCTFTQGPDVGVLKSAVNITDSIKMDNWELKVNQTRTQNQLEKIWLIVKYGLS